MLFEFVFHCPGGLIQVMCIGVADPDPDVEFHNRSLHKLSKERFFYKHCKAALSHKPKRPRTTASDSCQWTGFCTDCPKSEYSYKNRLPAHPRGSCRFVRDSQHPRIFHNASTPPPAQPQPPSPPQPLNLPPKPPTALEQKRALCFGARDIPFLRAAALIDICIIVNRTVRRQAALHNALPRLTFAPVVWHPAAPRRLAAMAEMHPRMQCTHCRDFAIRGWSFVHRCDACGCWYDDVHSSVPIAVYEALFPRLPTSVLWHIVRFITARNPSVQNNVKNWCIDAQDNNCNELRFTRSRFVAVK